MAFAYSLSVIAAPAPVRAAKPAPRTPLGMRIENATALVLGSFLEPWRVCRALGHARESYVYGQRLDRRGHLVDKWGARCTRCHTSDGGEVYHQGWLEVIPHHWRAFRWNLRRNMFRKCCDCGKPDLLLGRPVGAHPDCIPF
jgi:hypothetical protein